MLDALEYRSALNAAPDAILIVDADGKIKFASERVQVVFGYSPEELLDSCIDRLVPQKFRTAHVARRAAFAERPCARPMGSVIGLFGQRKDGSSVPVEISLAPLDTAKGLRIICSVRDAAMQQSELLRLFMGHMPGAAAMLDTQMRYIAVTKAWLRDYGLGDMDVIGRSHYEIFPEIPERWREIHRRALKGESFSATEDSFLRADGHTDWVDWQIQPWRTISGEVAGFFIFSEVTTARHETAAALAESESRFRGAFDHSSIGMALVAPDGRWLRVNPALCDMLGYTPEQLLATDFQELTHPNDLEAELDLVREMLAGRRSHYHMEKRYYHKNGHVIWAMSSVSLIKDTGGRPLYFVSQIRDTTQRKIAFDRIRALVERLETVRDHERRAVSQLIYDGIMQDLSAMRLTVTALEARSKEHAEVVGACRHLSQAFDKCFADLRQFADGMQPIMLSNISVTDALTDHAQYFSRLSRLRIEIIEGESFPPLGEASKLLLFRAAQEAITNVALHAQAQSVKISLRSNAAQVIMDVIDDGIGIDEGVLSKPGSLGLLALSERFENVGGGVRIERNEGQGTTLSVFLPRETA